jgi:hypothetical protein
MYLTYPAASQREPGGLHSDPFVGLHTPFHVAVAPYDGLRRSVLNFHVQYFIAQQSRYRRPMPLRPPPQAGYVE